MAAVASAISALSPSLCTKTKFYVAETSAVLAAFALSSATVARETLSTAF